MKSCDDKRIDHSWETGLAHRATRRVSQGGYILLEATVALFLLGVVSYAIHGTFQQALMTRAQAQDYTRVRFLLEQVLAEQQLQPLVTQSSGGGFFDNEEDSRFMWEYEIRKITLPKPKVPDTSPPDGGVRGEFKYPKESSFLVHVVVTVTWMRGGQEFSESLETLFSPRKLWQSEDEWEQDW